MPEIPKHRKIKRATMLIKRSQCLRNYSKKKSYKPLCEKLRTNNNSLAKALSKEKQECQLLFTQNVALVAEVQDLGLACSKRDAVISKILYNAKEMLKMLVSITGYVTNTISSCQEFATFSGVNLQMTSNSAGKRESYKRLSTKSPARGVVKPMVSGHTITKPTINLSRVNMQHISASNLGIIQEVSTPPRNQEENDLRSPVAVPIRQRVCESVRTCRLPERLIVSSARISDENERRLSKKRSSRRSRRLSGKHSKPKTGRLSGRHSNKCSAENVENIGSPRVKLNDVSKFLQNSQSINIRMLTENQNDHLHDSPENSDDMNQDSGTRITIPETPPSASSKKESDKTVENVEEGSTKESSNIDHQAVENTNNVQNRTSDWEDPLEGPSWLLDDSQTVPCLTSENEKPDANISDNDNTSDVSLMSETLDNTLHTSNTEGKQQTTSLPVSNKLPNYARHFKADKLTNVENNCRDLFKKVTEHNAFNSIPTSTASSDSGENECKEENDVAISLQNFVTRRRDYYESEEEDDFTLMYVREPRNMHFDINDLKLPVLEESVVKPVTVTEPEPEITATIPKIPQIGSVPSISNNTMNESAFDQSTVKLPLLINDDFEGGTTPLRPKRSEILQQGKKTKKATSKNLDDSIDRTSVLNKGNGQQKKKKQKGVNNKDPSTVKVVLEKLNEFNVKSRTPSPEEVYTQESGNFSSPVSSRVDNSSDSESSNASMNSICFNRPRRKRAPVSLYEPNLRKKLRRNQ